MQRIVVGFDDSEGARQAAAWGAALAAAGGSDVVLLAAAPPDSSDHVRLERAMKAHRWRIDDPRVDEHSGEVTGVVVDVAGGDPREVLAAADRTHGADLVVVGREGTDGSPGLFHLGSVAEYLAHHTSVPLLVVPPDAPPTFDRIVVGVDGSPASHAAARWCAEVASATNGRVSAVMVREPFLEWTPEVDPDAWHRDTERRITNEFGSELTTAGVEATPVAVRGRLPVDGILHAAQGADLLVVGLRPLAGALRFRAGGVAFGALHNARCAVALVPAPTERRSS